MIPLSFLLSVSGCNLKCVMKEKKELQVNLIDLLTLGMMGYSEQIPHPFPLPASSANPQRGNESCESDLYRAKWERVGEKETVKYLKVGLLCYLESETKNTVKRFGSVNIYHKRE